MSDQWIQHVSSQGEKFKVLDCDQHYDEKIWFVNGKNNKTKWNLFLPKTEYQVCEPPEQWVDVTKHCTFDAASILEHPEEGGHGWTIFTRSGLSQDDYRLKKVRLFKSYNAQNSADEYTQWAFIVEKRQP